MAPSLSLSLSLVPAADSTGTAAITTTTSSTPSRSRDSPVSNFSGTGSRGSADSSTTGAHDSAHSTPHRRNPSINDHLQSQHKRRRSSLSLVSAVFLHNHRHHTTTTTGTREDLSHPLPTLASAHPPAASFNSSSSVRPITSHSVSPSVVPTPDLSQPEKSVWAWSARRRSKSIGAAEHRRLQRDYNAHHPPHQPQDAADTDSTNPRTDGLFAQEIVVGKGLIKSPGQQQQKSKKNWRQSLHHHASRSTSNLTSASASSAPRRQQHHQESATTTPRASPPPTANLVVDSVPSVPRLTFGANPEASETATHHRSGSATASPALDPRTVDPVARKEPHFERAGDRSPPRVQGLGLNLSVESRYSRWGRNIATSRSQDSLSLRSERSSDRSQRTSPYTTQGPQLPQQKQLPPVPVPRAVGGSGGGGSSGPQQQHGQHIADMSGSRRRSISANNTAQPQDPYRNHDGDAGSRMSDLDGTDAPRGKDRREQDKKTMLSKALQKAHTAVLLDNAHNFEGAIEAYDDACRLLGQVLIRSAGEDDRRKLDAIRTTYTNRIQELHQINREAAQASGKNLPARPMSNESLLASPHDTPLSHRSLEPEPRSEQISTGQSSGMARSSANTLASQQSARTESSIASQPRIEEPPKQVQPPAPVSNGLPLRSNTAQNETLQPATFQSTERYLTIGSPMDPSYAPPPLSPRRTPVSETEERPFEQLQPVVEASKGHSRANSGNSISWLDTIDESGGSSDGFSVHSEIDGALSRKHVRVPSGDTEAEFDAALDAAVEAAYADGMEPFDYDEQPLDYKNTLLSEPVKKMVDTERKRLSDRTQIIQQAHARTKQLTKEGQLSSRQSRDLYRLSDDDAEEERILGEMQKDYGFDFGLQSKSSMPRQSDSSEYSGASTYHSSMSSSKATALSSSLSTVSEGQQDPSSLPKPKQELPRLSEESSIRDSLPMGGASQFGGPLPSGSPNPGAGVRSRRMSGQNAKQLKIETSMPPKKSLPQPPPTAPPTTIRVEEAQSAKLLTAKSDTHLLPDSIFQPSSQASATALQPPTTLVTQSSPIQGPDSPTARDAIPTPTTPAPGLGLSSENRSPGPDKPGKDKPTALKKNKSSVSLKTRNMSISSPDGSEVGSAGTPLSTSFTTFSNNSRKNLLYKDSNIPPTPGLPSFGESLTQTASNVNLFESDLHSPYVPGSPNPLAANAPIPLEPCPESHLLRPYWLMRCFYQTIAHPRGGYLSTKLFVPRDVWRVKGVKIKAMEEKIANCDQLTAGLQKISNADSFDAAAVLEEMQQFELILDQVQSSLAKKLGSDVSVQGIQTLFKDAPALAGDSTASPSAADGNTSSSSSSSRAVSQGKSFLSSMRKLRSKSSAVTLANNPTGPNPNNPLVREPGTKDNLTMSTLPMTNLTNPRFAKREIAKLEVSGPHAQYMESLAKLCDAVQVIDQVARQVEDPGLKHSSPTHVGLELSTRHASEFFGFYICRFVLTDLTMLLDKFIKRGSEWVVV